MIQAFLKILKTERGSCTSEKGPTRTKEGKKNQMIELEPTMIQNATLISNLEQIKIQYPL